MLRKVSNTFKKLVGQSVINNLIFTSVMVGMTGLVLMSNSYAQMQEPWNAQPRNRASIANMMRQVERPLPAAKATTTVTNLVCGSDGSSSAKGNSSCMILNNAAGDVDLGQDANGNQEAISNHSTSSSSGSDEVLETLEGS